MSSADLLEDGFPHGLPVGYDRGCKSSHCPEADDGRLSCLQASIRYSADYGYRKRVDAGMSALQLHEFDVREQERQRDQLAGARARKAAAAVVVEESVAEVVAVDEPALPVEEEVIDVPDVDVPVSPAEEVPVAEPEATAEPASGFEVFPVERRKPGRKPGPFPHGTNRGWERGCREDCPVEPSCSRAHEDFLAAKRDEKPKPAGNPRAKSKPAKPKPTPVAPSAEVEVAAKDAPDVVPQPTPAAEAVLEAELAALQPRGAFAVQVDPTEAGGVLLRLSGQRRQVRLDVTPDGDLAIHIGA